MVWKGSGELEERERTKGASTRSRQNWTWQKWKWSVGTKDIEGARAEVTVTCQGSDAQKH